MFALIPKDFVLSLVRHALSAGGAWMVAKGLTDADSAQALIGGVMGTVAVAWSHWVHTP